MMHRASTFTVVQGMCRVGNKPCTFSALGARALCRVCRVCRVVTRARACTCAGEYAGVNRPCDFLFFSTREEITMHTLHTMHRRWGSKAKSVQGLFLTLHMGCTFKKNGNGEF